MRLPTVPLSSGKLLSAIWIHHTKGWDKNLTDFFYALMLFSCFLVWTGDRNVFLLDISCLAGSSAGWKRRLLTWPTDLPPQFVLSMDSQVTAFYGMHHLWLVLCFSKTVSKRPGEGTNFCFLDINMEEVWNFVFTPFLQRSLLHIGKMDLSLSYFTERLLL